MGSIAIKLDPQKIVNPDLDLRYLVPDRIEELTHGTILDDGYDYLDDEAGTMIIFLRSEQPGQDAAQVREILDTTLFKGSGIAEAAQLYFCEKSETDLEACDYNLGVYTQFEQGD